MELVWLGFFSHKSGFAYTEIFPYTQKMSEGRLIVFGGIAVVQSFWKKSHFSVLSATLRLFIKDAQT